MKNKALCISSLEEIYNGLSLTLVSVASRHQTCLSDV